MERKKERKIVKNYGKYDGMWVENTVKEWTKFKTTNEHWMLNKIKGEWNTSWMDAKCVFHTLIKYIITSNLHFTHT